MRTHDLAQPILAALCLIATVAGPARADRAASEAVERTFTLAAVEGHRKLVVDNVMGAISIVGDDGDTVRLSLQQTWSADDAAELAQARDEVKLEVREQPGRLELVQGGPWRCRGERHGDGRRDCCCDHDERDYEVRFDWTLTVPADLDLEVRNVNDGTIRVAGVRGRLEVKHVNDDVTLENVAGQVDAGTVNGELAVRFAALPTGDLEFSTVNGDIDLSFPKGLGAELTFHTLNGEVFTDFPFTLAALPPTSERSDRGRGKHRHQLGGRTKAVLGGGGVALDCDTVNGDITIRER